MGPDKEVSTGRVRFGIRNFGKETCQVHGIESVVRIYWHDYAL